MEKAAKVPVCIPFPVPDFSSDNIDSDHHCFQESQEKWQELQQFWVEEKHFDIVQGRRQQHLSSSLERHLLFDECVQEPRDDEDISPDVNKFVEKKGACRNVVSDVSWWWSTKD